MKTFVIHLPNEARRERIAAGLAKVGLEDVHYIHAREPFQKFTCTNMRRNPRGEFGCALSHLKAISAALASGCSYALFIEDDVEFARDLSVIEPALSGDWRIGTMWQTDPPWPDWDVIYLGGHPRGPVVPGGTHEGWFRIRGGFSCAEAYILHRASMTAFLQFWCDRAGQPNAMFDFILGEFATQANGYAVYPTITHQPPGWSHIGQKHDDKQPLIERGWKANLPDSLVAQSVEHSIDNRAVAGSNPAEATICNA